MGSLGDGSVATWRGVVKFSTGSPEAGAVALTCRRFGFVGRERRRRREQEVWYWDQVRCGERSRWFPICLLVIKESVVLGLRLRTLHCFPVWCDRRHLHLATLRSPFSSVFMFRMTCGVLMAGHQRHPPASVRVLCSRSTE